MAVTYEKTVVERQRDCHQCGGMLLSGWLAYEVNGNIVCSEECVEIELGV
jgi:hypothetical protein